MPDFLQDFFQHPDDMSMPLASGGGTVMHLAFKKGEFELLDQLIIKGGNPFVENKEGQTIEMLVQGLGDDNKFKAKLIRNIEIFYERHQRNPKESLIHSAVRQNSLGKVKILKFFGGRFDTFNHFKQVPVEIAVENGHLEMFLFLFSITGNFNGKDKVTQKCRQFLADQIERKSFTAYLVNKYKPVLEKFFRSRGTTENTLKTIMETLAKSSDVSASTLLANLLAESAPLQSEDSENGANEVIDETKNEEVQNNPSSADLHHQTQAQVENTGQEMAGGSLGAVQIRTETVGNGTGTSGQISPDGEEDDDKDTETSF